MRRRKEPLAVRLHNARRRSNELYRKAYDLARDLDRFESLFEFMRTRAEEFVRESIEHRDELATLLVDADAGTWPVEQYRAEPSDARLRVEPPPVPERLSKVLEHVNAEHAKRLEARRAKYHQRKGAKKS